MVIFAVFNVLLQVDQLAKKLENPTAPDVETVVE